MRTVKRKYHYFYKITNNLNGHYYYGIHSTDNLDDGYMGSGTRLRYAYEKYGIENFTKEILKFFETREDAAKHEADVVNEVLIKDENCYNIIHGGETRTTFGTATVKDQNGNIMQVPVDDPRYLSGELISIMTNKVIVQDSMGNIMAVDSTDQRYLSGELKYLHSGNIRVIDKNNNSFMVKTTDPRYLSGELTHWSKNKVTVKDKTGNYFSVSKDDPRYLSGELKPIWSGRKRKQETIEKVKRTFEEIGHQRGEKNSQYGTCWITKEGENKKIKKEELELFEQQGWKRGRVVK